MFNNHSKKKATRTDIISCKTSLLGLAVFDMRRRYSNLKVTTKEGGPHKGLHIPKA